ncbi:MAG: MBL fold metallo-hydrolase [Candidatus Cloacimonadota bacterium]|nr:MBL fold metallo-hydrolase [Candidatus Cloacimonadota bacterium]
MFNIQWFGHSMWKIWDNKRSIIIDPFDDIGYKIPEDLTADILLVTHTHHDHSNISVVKGNPKLIAIDGKYYVHGIPVETFSVWHDEEKGKKLGQNLLIKFQLAGKNFLHCGDLGHRLDQKMIEKLGNIDLLFIPVGGKYTIDAKIAKDICHQLQPNLIFPMHYNTKKLNYKLDDVDVFLKHFKNIEYVKGKKIKITEEFFKTQKVVVFSYE